jgi:hypothetical protein
MTRRLGGGATLLGRAIAYHRGQTRGKLGDIRLVTSREGPGTLERRRGHCESLGRRWRSSGYTRRRPVSTDQAKQRGWGANQRVSRVADEEVELTEATDEVEARRRPKSGQRTTAELHGRAQSERERESEVVRLRAQLSGGSE